MNCIFKKVGGIQLLGFTPIWHRLSFREILVQRVYSLQFLLNCPVNLKLLLRNRLMKRSKETALSLGIWLSPPHTTSGTRASVLSSHGRLWSERWQPSGPATWLQLTVLLFLSQVKGLRTSCLRWSPIRWTRRLWAGSAREMPREWDKV